MNYIRKTLVGTATTLLPLTLFSFGLLFSVYQVLGNPDNVKHALTQSGIYDVAVADLLEQSQKDAQVTGSTSDIPTDQPEVKSAINKAFSPDLLKSQVGNALDGSYSWAQGDSKNLSFDLNFSQAKTDLANYLSSYAKDRVAKLPVCPAGTPITTDFDPLNATCKPAGLDEQMVADKAKQDVLQSSFLSDSTINAGDLKDSQGNSISKQFNIVPTVYKRTVLSLYISAATALLMIIGIVLLSKSRRAGIRRVAIIVLTIGILSTILSWLSSFVMGKLVDGLAKTDSQAIQVKILEIIHILISDLRIWWMGFGIISIGIGIGALVTLRATKPKDISDTPAIPTDTPPAATTHIQ